MSRRRSVLDWSQSAGAFALTSSASPLYTLEHETWQKFLKCMSDAFSISVTEGI